MCLTFSDKLTIPVLAVAVVLCTTSTRRLFEPRLAPRPHHSGLLGTFWAMPWPRKVACRRPFLPVVWAPRLSFSSVLALLGLIWLARHGHGVTRKVRRGGAIVGLDDVGGIIIDLIREGRRLLTNTYCTRYVQRVCMFFVISPFEPVLLCSPCAWACGTGQHISCSFPSKQN